MNEKLIFDLGRPGRRGCMFPKSRLSHMDVKRFIPEDMLDETGKNLPDLAELDVIRHYTRLSQKNFSVDSHFYPLGSCTMKYNPKINEALADLPGFTDIHPYQSQDTVQGCLELLHLLETALTEITGMDAFSLMPAAGAHGELTALFMTKAWFEHKKENRPVILVPDSSHGTNPASAAMCGMKVVQIASNDRGLVDVEDLDRNLGEEVACLMMTNPNTLGLFEEDIVKIAAKVHEKGGLLYYDGANLNATMGIVRPGDAGFDFVHLNVHKTLSTPHGGGGPGAGPVGARGELVGFLPQPRVVKTETGYALHGCAPLSIGRVRTFYGNFLVLVKTLAYVMTLGKDYTKRASQLAVLNANYLRKALSEIFRIPYDGTCMHEFVASAETQLQKRGVRAADICKRMLDYGVHAPTVYFPLIVKEALMIEPTETESKETLDGFIEILKKINEETETDPQLLKDAPLTMPVKRLDDVAAARKPNLRWTPGGKA